MNDISVNIQPEAPDDAVAIERLHERTFGPGRYAKTAYRLREQVDHIRELSFTARIGTLLIGSVWLSPIRIGEAKALLLGPVTVEPAFRDRGVGQPSSNARSRKRRTRAIVSSFWSATKGITRNPASSAFRVGGRSCLVRSIRRGCCLPNWRKAPLQAYPARYGRIERLKHDPEKWAPVFGKDHARAEA